MARLKQVRVRQQQFGREAELFGLQVKTQPLLLAELAQPVEVDAAGTLLAGEAVVVEMRRVAFRGDQFVEQIHLPDNHGVKVMRDGPVHQFASLFPVPVSLIIQLQRPRLPHRSLPFVIRLANRHYYHRRAK